MVGPGTAYIIEVIRQLEKAIMNMVFTDSKVILLIF